MPTDTLRRPARSTRPARDVVTLAPTLRALRREVARWALANGRALNVDALTVILAARHDEAVSEAQPFNRWTSNGVLVFLFGTADDWCDRHGVARQPYLGESMRTYVDFLSASRVLAAGSSPVRQLRSTIDSLAGLSPEGHHRGEPPGDVPLAPLRALPVTRRDGRVS